MFHDTLVLDVHGHVSAPPGAYHFLTTLLGSNTAKPSPIGRSGPKGVPIEQFQASARDHVAYLDARAIDVQLIGPRPYLHLGWMEPHLAPAWARYVNDVIHQQVSMYPARFVGAAQLPFVSEAPDTRGLLGELDRCVTELGFAAAYAAPDAGGRRTQPGMHEPYWFPLYERCEGLNVPLIVHGTNALDPRIRALPANYQYGFLTEQYLAGQMLSHGDVFERYPGLRVIVCHCGGALDRFIPTDPHLAQKDLSANLFYDSCGYDVVFLEAAIKQRGVGRMCFGTEAPGSGMAVRPETGRTSDDLIPVIDGFPFLTETDKIKIIYDNPLRVVPGFAAAISARVTAD